MKRISVLLVCLGLVACSKSPSSPSNFAQIGGSWQGTIASGNWQTFAIDLFLTQSAGTVTGTWGSAVADWNGQITGTVDKNSFSGTFTISTPQVGGGTRCTGSASIGGSASTGATTLTWTGAGFTGSCTGLPVAVTFALRR